MIMLITIFILMIMIFCSPPPHVGSKQEIIVPADLPLVQELSATLREWAQIWHKLFVVGHGCHPISCFISVACC